MVFRGVRRQEHPNLPHAQVPYIFAAPRFGTRRRSKSLTRFPYKNRWDVVPHLPPRLLGYSDAGFEPEALVGKSNGVVGIVKGIVGFIRIKPHYIESYRSRLRPERLQDFGELIYAEQLIKMLR